jgi:alkylation response protein AidB-like acyl-CoA dehydrogenase
VIAPLNWEGDKNPSSFQDGVVTTTPGFKEAFKQYAEGGWQGLQHPVDFGGQGLPKTIGAACGEILKAANMSFALCPLLTDGAIEALLTAGSDELKAIYLEKLVSGQWTGTMNLTEPQAGSDLAWCAPAPSRSPTARTRCSAPRFSSPTVSTTWPRTSSIWCWPASWARPRA